MVVLVCPTPSEYDISGYPYINLIISKVLLIDLDRIVGKYISFINIVISEILLIGLDRIASKCATEDHQGPVGSSRRSRLKHCHFPRLVSTPRHLQSFHCIPHEDNRDQTRQW